VALGRPGYGPREERGEGWAVLADWAGRLVAVAVGQEEGRWAAGQGGKIGVRLVFSIFHL
jgi:hypothetical protein